MTDTTTFRYEGFTVGQRIRAHDFAPRAGRGACAIEGPITQVCRDGSEGRLYAHYVVAVERDIWRGDDVPPGVHVARESRVGTSVCVPMEKSMLDWDGRVIMVDQLGRAVIGPHSHVRLTEEFNVPSTDACAIPVDDCGVVKEVKDDLALVAWACGILMWQPLRILELDNRTQQIDSADSGDEGEARYFRQQEQAREVHYPDAKGHPDE